jgi:DNA-binding NtrC family response regulator
MKSSPPTGNAPCILLVDHDLSLREEICETLNSDGFDTCCAANRHEALEWLKRDDIAAVILNMRMPGAESIGTIMAVRAHSPGMKLIAISGGAADGAGNFLPLAKSLGASAVLADARDRNQLLDTVHGLLSPGLQQMAS